MRIKCLVQGHCRCQQIRTGDLTIDSPCFLSTEPQELHMYIIVSLTETDRQLEHDEVLHCRP